MKITLRFTLSSVITALTVFISLSIFLISYFGSMDSLLLLTNNMTNEVAKGIIEKTRTLFDSAERANDQIAFLIRNGVLNLRDGKAVMETAAAWIAENEGFTSVDIGLPSGDKYKAERMPDDSISMRSYVRDAKNVRMTWRHANPVYNDDPKYQATVKELAKGYDPRTRPWWITAVSSGKTGWTDMYVSGLRKQFVYSCATPVFDAGRKLLAVSSIDINVVALSEFLGTLNILQHGKAFILNDKKQVIAVPIKNDAELDQLVRINPVDKENPYTLYPLEELPNLTIRRSVELYLLKQATDKSGHYFEFTGDDNEPYICRITDFPYKENTTFTIGIIIPKNDVMATINERSRYILAGIVLFTLVALGIGMAISKTMSRSLSSLAGEVAKVGRLDLASDGTVNSRLLEVHNIAEAVDGMRNGLRSFKKYVPADLVAHLNAQRKEAVLEGERRELTVFFSDIADFTSIAERLPAEALVENLGVYFDGISTIIHEHLGTLDKYIGDSVMAFWGAPIPRDNHAVLACASALACQAFLDDLRRRWTQSDQPIFDTRIGIHTGEVIVGNIGSAMRMNYTCIGDNVNLASRLEGLNKYYGTRIILSDACFGQLAGQFAVRKLDVVAVKGKAKGILIYELLGHTNDVAATTLALAEQYGRAFDLYLNRQWEQARAMFLEALALADGKDTPCALLASRCEQYEAAPPDADWNGVYCMQGK
jgi:adenylate cyclase